MEFDQDEEAYASASHRTATRHTAADMRALRIRSAAANGTVVRHGARNPIKQQTTRRTIIIALPPGPSEGQRPQVLWGSCHPKAKDPPLGGGYSRERLVALSLVSPGNPPIGSQSWNSIIPLPECPGSLDLLREVSQESLKNRKKIGKNYISLTNRREKVLQWIFTDLRTDIWWLLRGH